MAARKPSTYIRRDVLERMTMELDDARYGLHAAMVRPTSDPQWTALAMAAMSNVHNLIVWLIHEEPMKTIHARNWRERHALEQGSGSGEGQ